MRFGSVFSGIEAASLAWPGWRCAFFAEIDPFASAVLAHRHPSVPNLGDVNDFRSWPDADLDVLVGGSPCQSFSVAGLRKGLADPRGNLMLTYLAIAARYRPEWLVWENVPGVLSVDEGRAFGSFLGGLAQLGYGFAYRVLDAQYFRVAQRRRRVFVVANARDWRRAAAVLFERASLRGDPAPSREAWQNAAASLTSGSHPGSNAPGRRREDDYNLVTPPISGCSNGGGANGPGRSVDDVEALVVGIVRSHPYPGSNEVGTLALANPLPGHHPRTDLDNDTILVMSSGQANAEITEGVAPSLTCLHEAPIAFAQNQREELRELGVASSIPASRRGDAKNETLLAVNLRGRAEGNVPETSDLASVRASSGGSSRSLVAFSMQAGVTRENVASGPDGAGVNEEIAYTVEARAETQMVAFADLADPVAANQARTYTREGTHNFRLSNVAASRSSIRRLTPRECERLQGFPDDYTLIDYRGKPASDSPRYKAIGNSMAVPCMRWIGERIEAVQAIVGER